MSLMGSTSYVVCAATDGDARVATAEPGVSWADLAYLCELGVGQLGGARLYHWVGVRGYDGAVFQLANPSPGWKGIQDDLDANEWNAWGSWTAVFVTGVQ